MAKAICAVDGCDSFAKSRGWCGMHYQRWRAHGDVHMVAAGGRRKSDAALRFWATVPPVPDIATLPDDAFGHWLAGFIDGEGSFQIIRLPERQRYGPSAYGLRFSIALREDDAPLLMAVYRRTGLGSVGYYSGRQGPTRPSVHWMVGRKAHCKALSDLLERYPLLSKKARDFEVWRRAVLIWQQSGRRRACDWSELGRLKAELESARRYVASPPGEPATPS